MALSDTPAAHGSAHPPVTFFTRAHRRPWPRWIHSVPHLFEPVHPQSILPFTDPCPRHQLRSRARGCLPFHRRGSASAPPSLNGQLRTAVPTSSIDGGCCAGAPPPHPSLFSQGAAPRLDTTFHPWSPRARGGRRRCSLGVRRLDATGEPPPVFPLFLLLSSSTASPALAGIQPPTTVVACIGGSARCQIRASPDPAA